MTSPFGHRGMDARTFELVSDNRAAIDMLIRNAWKLGRWRFEWRCV